MDEAILKRLFKICEAARYSRDHAHDHLLAGQQLGGHRATLLDLLMKGKLEDHALEPGDIVCSPRWARA